VNWSVQLQNEANGVYKRDYTFRMNVMEEIFEIRSCIEILVNDIIVGWMDVCTISTVYTTVYTYK